MAVASDGEKLDINDVSFLWPLAKTAADVDALISLDDLGHDGEIVPDAVFKNLMSEAQTVSVGSSQKIGFPGNLSTNRHSWKIVGIRVNPSAFGKNPAVVAKTGEVPGIRLIVQPVEVKSGLAVPHDFAAHVVFNFISNAQMPFVPDRTAFLPAIKELQKIKADLKSAGIDTSGKALSVHPGFARVDAKLAEKLRAFIKNHLRRSQLQVISFMGIPKQFDPWIFFRVEVKPDNSLVRGPIRGHFATQNVMSQMLSFAGGDKVVPKTSLEPTAVAEGFGVSTAPLFESNVANNLEQQLFPGVSTAPLSVWKVRDIPDVIANPLIHHTGNTDCVSCHSESTRRVLVSGLKSQPGVAFSQPANIAGLDPAVLPKDNWNVRDFGWGFNFSVEPGFHPTITQRASNEAAESVDQINRSYLGF